MSNPTYSQFIKALNRVRRTRHYGLLLAEIIRIITLTACIATVYGVLDRLLGFDEQFRLAAGVICIIFIAAVFSIRIIILLLENKKRIAELIDDVSESSRREVLSAYELGTDAKTDSDLKNFLIGKVLDQAFTIVRSMRFSNIFPAKKLVKSLKLCGAQLLISLILFGLNPTAANTIAKRILFPLRDIPPYSQLKFKITPDAPKVIYGDNIEISAKITGGKVASQVIFLSKDKLGNHNRFNCFREGNSVFVQKLDKLTVPMQFCFKCGRARSKWHQLSLLLQPRISIVQIRITPPAYSGLPIRSFFGGGDVLDELKGSKAALTITSNRPLASGSLKLNPETLEPEKIIKGRKSSLHSVTFEWTVTCPAKLTFNVTDILGTACRKPLVIKQKLRLDSPPLITVNAPDNFIMATPDSVIGVSISSEDDLGLKRVDVVRAVEGYRDRIKALAEAWHEKYYDYNGKIDLKGLGVTPGQNLELYFEAFDYNPTMTGSTSSDFVRIKVISKLEYARILRDRSMVKELASRYRLMAYKLYEYDRSLLELKKALSGKPSNSEIKKRIKKVAAAFKSAREVFIKLSEDFVIYNIENRHREILTRLTQKLSGHDEIIKSMSANESQDGLIRKINRLLGDTAKGSCQLAGMEKDAQQLAIIENILREALKLTKLAEQQKMLVKRLSVYKSDSSQERIARLPEFGVTQQGILDELRSISKVLRENSDKLSWDFEAFKKGSREFLKKLRELQIDELMQSCSEQCKYRNGSKAYDYADRALEKLQQLLKDKKNPLSRACQGRCPNIRRDLNDTVKQMLDSLMNRLGGQRDQGQGPGSTSGGGEGDAENGFIGQGSSPLNVPVVGPPRHNMSDKDGTRLGNRDKTGNTGIGSGSGGITIGKDDREKINIREYQKRKSDSINIDEVPEKYRKAVKKYFGAEP